MRTSYQDSEMNIQDKVVEMYNKIPYPFYTDDSLKNYYVKKKYIDLVLSFEGQKYSVYNDKNVLEAGCGTGRESMYLATMGAKLTAIDITDESLNIAKNQAEKHNLKEKINFQKVSVLDLPFDNDHFDIVLSSGVIHHTDNPKRAFTELVRVLKPGGFLILYVYNNYAHLIPNLRRKLVLSIAGNNIHKRVKIAQKIFPFYVRKKNIAAIYDEFGHPHKSEHSIDEILNWFEQNNIDYKSVYPQFGIIGFIDTMRYQKNYINKNIFKKVNDKYNIPNHLNILSSNLIQFLRGFHSYSGGYRFLGRKR